MNSDSFLSSTQPAVRMKPQECRCSLYSARAVNLYASVLRSMDEHSIAVCFFLGSQLLRVKTNNWTDGVQTNRFSKPDESSQGSGSVVALNLCIPYSVSKPLTDPRSAIVLSLISWGLPLVNGALPLCKRKSAIWTCQKVNNFHKSYQ